MKITERIDAFSKLGEKINSLSATEIQELAQAAKYQNGWFDEKNVKNALNGIAFMLSKESLEKWTNKYPHLTEDITPKTIGIVMAGNIPLVGFHDLISVLISGHFAAIKVSSSDTFLMQNIVDWLIEIAPKLKKNIEFRDKLTEIDAVIATGSDNTSRYFEYYFKHIPNLIRKNRTSVAVLTGNETKDELYSLGNDILDYYGLGCRNISKILVPKDYNFTQLNQTLEQFTDVINHNKYRNNYDYQKSIFLVNKVAHFDNGVVLITESENIVSPVSVLYYEYYENEENTNNWLSDNYNKIQCVIGEKYIPYGKAQKPQLWDYADNVDTIAFLNFNK